MFQELRFREYYGHLADDELARIALTDQLVPAAQEALQEELQKRGLTDLSDYKRALDEAAGVRHEVAKRRVAALELHLVVMVCLPGSIWVIYHATGWLGIHNGDARAVITLVLLPVSVYALAALWRRISKRAWRTLSAR